MAEEQAVRKSFAGCIAAMRVPPLLAIADQWRPDLIVRDEMDFAGAVAAERLGLPHAAVVVIAAGGFARPDVVGEPRAQLRERQRSERQPTWSCATRPTGRTSGRYATRLPPFLTRDTLLRSLSSSPGRAHL